MACIRKKSYTNKSGKTTTKYYIIYRDINGKQCSSGTGYDSRKEAKKHLPEYENKIVEKTDPTVKDIFDLWFLKTKKYAESTQYNYTKYYDKYISPIENVKYKKLTTVFLQSFFDDIEKQSKHSASYTLKMCKSATNYAISKKRIFENKFNLVDTIKTIKSEKHPLTISSQLYVKQKARELLSKRDYVIIYAFIGSGLREGELFALNKSDIIYDNLYIDVNKQFSRCVLKPELKTEQSKRKVYIFSDLAELLKEYSAETPGEILFQNKDGGYVNPTNFRERVWKPFLKKIGISERVRIHDLRGTYVNTLLSEGCSLKFAQEQLGHAKSTTTVDWYTKNNEDMVNVAQSKLDKIFKNGGKMVEKSEQKTERKIIPFPKKQAI